MKEASGILLRDTKQMHSQTVTEASESNELLAAFAEWLGIEAGSKTLVDQGTQNAAKAKGAARTSRGLSVLGFRCVSSLPESETHAAFCQQLDWLLGKPNVDAAGEPCDALVDPVIFLGLVVGAEVALKLPAMVKFKEWATRLLADVEQMNGVLGWHRALFRLISAKISAAQINYSGVPLWLAAGLVRRGLAQVNDDQAAAILRDTLASADKVDPFEAAFRLSSLDWARDRALDLNLNSLTVANVIQILKNIQPIFDRWPWEDSPRTRREGAEARKWHVENEYHFQSLLYAILKPVFPALEEEQYLASIGQYQPRADLCLKSLNLLIEVKYWYSGRPLKDLTEEVAADRSLYLCKANSPYKQMIAIVWDEGARNEKYAEFEKGLMSLSDIAAVVMVPRPSIMVVQPPNPTGKAKKKRQ